MRVGKEEPSPVFIIGAARSGTRFLRDAIAAVPDIAAVPYDINYVWRRGNEDLPHDELDAVDVSEGLAGAIRRDVYRQAARDGARPPRMIVEKTVSNTLRVPFIDRIFPEALFIHLIRDGREVVESSYRCWQDRPDWSYLLRKARSFPLSRWRYALKVGGGLLMALGSDRSQRTWGPRYGGMREDLRSRPLEVVVARQWRRCVEASLEGLDSVPRRRVLSIRYEDLVTSPDWIPPLLDFLGFRDDVDVIASHYRETLRRPRGSRWETTFSEVQRDAIWDEIGEVVTMLGYPTYT